MSDGPKTDNRIPCNLCGCTSAELLYPTMELVKCTDCELIRAKEIMDRGKLERLYSESYFHSSDSGSLGYDDYIADRPKILKTFDTRMEEIENRLGRKGKLLDVGCATGFSLEAACKRGWEAYGVELSKFASEYARRKVGVDVFCGMLEEFESEPESFDVITMWDYIEHCPDPLGEIGLASRLLKAGGLLVLTTPNIASLPSRIWRSRWMGFKQDEHIYFFSPATIMKMFSRSRIETVHVRHIGKYIDIGFFIKRLEIYSETARRILDPIARMLGISKSVLYVNSHDVMIIYGEKVGGPE